MGASPQRVTGLYTVIAIKLGKSLLLLGLAFGIYSLNGQDLQAGFDHVLRLIRLDPEHEFFNRIGESLRQITPSNIRWVASGTLIYGLLLSVEGIGLIFRAFWAGWLAISETAFFIPIEIFKLVESYSTAILMILVVNIAIVWYLVQNRNRLFHHAHTASIQK